MKKFIYNIKERKIELTIKERINEYSCLISVVINGQLIAENEEASVCAVTGRPGLYLQFKSTLNDNTLLCICKKSEEDKNSRERVEKNREIADYIWKNIQNSDFYALSYEYTTSHWANSEE